MERTQRTRLGAVTVLVVVFGSGFALGLALDRRLGAEPADAVADSAAVGSSDRRDGERRPPMYRRVGELTEVQEARIDSIVRQHRGAMKELQREFRSAYDPRYWAIVERTREDIRSVMTPEQAVRYDSLVARYDERRRNDEDDTAGRR